MIKRYNSVPIVCVGIVGAKRITFALNGYGTTNEPRTATLQNGLILLDGKVHTQLRFEPQSPNDCFSLQDVIIGVNFHWERRDTDFSWDAATSRQWWKDMGHQRASGGRLFRERHLQ